MMPVLLLIQSKANYLLPNCLFGLEFTTRRVQELSYDPVLLDDLSKDRLLNQEALCRANHAKELVKILLDVLGYDSPIVKVEDKSL